MNKENKIAASANKRMKNRLNSKLEYYYGCGAGRYGEVLRELRVHGGVHSYRTSSIPLAEFWQPDNLERITAKLKPYLPGFDAERALKFFEFPTDPEVDGKCIGRASMTDLMLMDGELPSRCVALPDILGDKSPYFGLVSERMALADEGNYIASLNQYFKDGHQRGFQNLADATDKLEDFMWNDWAHINLPLHVMVTHDINVGGFLAGRKVVTEFDEFSWPHYLDAAVGFLDRCGRARYGYMRYKPNTYTFDC